MSGLYLNPSFKIFLSFLFLFRFGVESKELTASSNPKDIHFYVYSDPSHPDSYREVKVGDVTTLERSNLVTGNVIILADGWAGFEKSGMSNLLKNGYLKQRTPNIVIMKYELLNGEGTSGLGRPFSYIGSLKNVPTIGSRGADFVKFLHNNNIISGGNEVHLIGHSLGAHVLASVGYHLKMKYKDTIGRITGLDPAGPFASLLKKHGLSKDKANFVDVIHTGIGVLGTKRSIGHADFFINGGLWTSIPGCSSLEFSERIVCAHKASALIYYKTIVKQESFTGCNCSPLPAKVIMKCGLNTVCQNPTIVGEDCPWTARGDFFVKTNEDVRTG